MRIRACVFLGLFLLGAFPMTSWAQLSDHYYFNADTDGLALRGYDPVAYFTEETAVKGSAAHAATHKGITYHFSSAENRRRFEANPDTYLPEYGGYCALGMAVEPQRHGYGRGKYDGHPENFKLIDGKVYLFFQNPFYDARAVWNNDPNPERMLARADSFWTDLTEAQHALTTLPEGMSPLAPPQTAQLHWLIGEWDITYKVLQGDSSYQSFEAGPWVARFSTDGLSIIDEWTNMGVAGVNIRTFDPDVNKWRCTWHQHNSATRSLFDGVFEDNELRLSSVVQNPEQAFRFEVRFYDIAADSFKWTMHTSGDGGKTWTRNVQMIEATRIR